MDNLRVLRLLLLIKGYDIDVLADIGDHIYNGVLADREVVAPVHPEMGEVVCTYERGQIIPLEYNGLFSHRRMSDQGRLFPLTPAGIWSAHLADLAEKDKNEHEG